MNRRTTFAIVLSGILSVSCAKQNIVLPSKDAPLLVTEVGTFTVRVSAWDAEKKSLVDLGWMSKDEIEGRTISQFDWEEYAKRQ